MKKCGYCGRENPDESDRCSDCGASLAESSVREPPIKRHAPPLFEWLWSSLRYAGPLILIALLYLLSYGPVDRYCGKVVTRVSTSTTYTRTTKVIVHYPLWVRILYRPALHLRFRSELYQRYIAWWNRADELNR
jgi:predicted amidophosphoribosyltransferase